MTTGNIKAWLSKEIYNPDNDYVRTLEKGIVDLIEIPDTEKAQIHINMRAMKVGYNVNAPCYFGVDASFNSKGKEELLSKEMIEDVNNLLLYHGENCKFILENTSECIYTWELKQISSIPNWLNLYIPIESEQTVIRKTEDQIKESYYKIKKRDEQYKETDECILNKIKEKYIS